MKTIRYLRQLAIFLVLLAGCSLLMYSVYTSVEAKTIAQVNSEQQVHAEQAAQGIVRFFSTYNSTLSFLALNNHIIDTDTEGRQLIRDFYASHAGEISSITRVDENGTILYTYPYETSTGANISLQPHVRKSIETGGVVVSDVFTSVQGFRTISFAMPVYDEGVYKGSLSILVPFDRLTAKNLEPVTVLRSGHAWTINQNGVILTSPDPGKTDRSAFEAFGNSREMNAFLEAAMLGRPGSSTYTLAREDGGRAEIYDAVFYPAVIGDTRWTVIVATPRNEILATLQTFQRDMAVVFCILVAILIVFTYYLVRARDIVREEEERRAAAFALQESERKYRYILENMQDLFYRTDRENRLIMVSPFGVKLLGYASMEEMLGKQIRNFYANPDERDYMLQEIEKHGSITNFETRLLRADGTAVTVLANSHTVYDDKGNVIGIEGVIRDISDRKLTENALVQATKKLNLLTTITTNNIRNSAFTLSGYLELEQQQTDEAKRREFHDKEAALLSQINAWLTVAKSYQDLGLNPPRWHPVSTTFILAVSHLEWPDTITRRVDAEGIEVYADPLLETVFFNLAENVIRHAATATVFTLRYEITPQGLTLIIEDNGRGVPGPMKAAIFEREYTPARGVGLFMAREILGITGITIRENGTEGKGARFEIVVPPGGYRFTKEQP
ncbi:MAG: PAS domain S-box protein [Methanomicrobiales archaeon]|nr:PAS domain S-box protein [Methanomicrobiales archaeon]